MGTRTKRCAIARVGVDLAKSVIHVHAVEADGTLVVSKQLTREGFVEWCAQLPKGCLVAMEACCAAHYWGRTLVGLGLNPRLISASLVVPYRLEGKTAKSDAKDAAAICEAASRPQMRFVGIKTEEQQALLAVHALRDGYVKDRTACINRMRGLMAEFGLILPKTSRVFRRGVAELLERSAEQVPPLTLRALEGCLEHFRCLEQRIHWCDQQIARHVASDPAARLAHSLPGIGVMGASALVATVGDPTAFRNGRQFSAWLGLVPRQHGTGGRQSLGSITRRGDGYLRKLFVLGARAALRAAARKDDNVSRWALQLKERIGPGKAAVALANKNARTVWRLLAQRQADPSG